jgi:hypothetical protein
LDSSDILLAQPGSLAEAFKAYQTEFGDGFVQRALEAIRCRNAEAWLACCVMVGAAAESILLAIAIAKEGDEEKVLRAYGGASGRRRVLDMIVGQASKHIKDRLETFPVSSDFGETKPRTVAPRTSERQTPTRHCASYFACASGLFRTGCV